jgi:hypothetical protein
MADPTLRAIVRRMKATGESDERIAAVVKRYTASSAAPEPRDEKSLGDFAQNLVSSGANFVKDTALGAGSVLKMAAQSPQTIANAIIHPVDTAQNVAEFAGNVPGMAKAVGKAAYDRYGTLENAGNTLYDDPVGALSDVASVASLGSTALATKAPRVARTLAMAERVTNPLQAAKPVAKATEYATAAAVRPFLKPGKALRRQQGSAFEIERTALKEGAVTEGLASKKQMASSSQARAMANQAQGTTPRSRIVDMPESLDEVSKGLNVPSDVDSLAKLEADAVASLPPDVDATRLLDTRQRLDDELRSAYTAAQRGGAPTGARQIGQQEMLGNVRSELRDLAPGIREVDDRTRRLGLVRNAIDDAGLRAGDIPLGAGLLGAGAASFGVPGAGTLAGGFALGRTFPQIPLALGSVPVRATAALANAGKGGRAAGLYSRLFELLMQQEMEGQQP